MANPAMQPPLRVEYTDVHPNEPKYGTAIQIIRTSFLDPSYQSSWRVHSLRTVKNYRLYTLYQAKAKELRQMGRDTTEHDMFTCYKTMDLIRNILENGLQTRQSSFNFLGDSRRGVNLCKHADIQLKAAENTGQEECYLIMYKVMLGKALPVLPSPDNHELSPIEGYDSHISNQMVNQKSPLGQQAIRSQVFCYEYVNGELLSCPRHVLPYVVVCYRRGRSNAIPPTPSMPVLSMAVQPPPQARLQMQPPPPPLVQMAPAPRSRHPGYFSARMETPPNAMQTNANFQPRLPPKNPFVPPTIPMIQPYHSDPILTLPRPPMMIPPMSHSRTMTAVPMHIPSCTHSIGSVAPMPRQSFGISSNMEPSQPPQRTGMRLPYVTPSSSVQSQKSTFNQPVRMPLRPPISSTNTLPSTSRQIHEQTNHSPINQSQNNTTMFNNPSCVPTSNTANPMTIALHMPPNATVSAARPSTMTEDLSSGIGMRLPIVIQPEGTSNNSSEPSPFTLGSHMRLPTVIAPLSTERPTETAKPSGNNRAVGSVNQMSAFTISQKAVTKAIEVKKEKPERTKRPMIMQPIIIDEEEEIDDALSTTSHGSAVVEPIINFKNNDLDSPDVAVDLSAKHKEKRTGAASSSPISNVEDELVIDDPDVIDSHAIPKQSPMIDGVVPEVENVSQGRELTRSSSSFDRTNTDLQQEELSSNQNDNVKTSNEDRPNITTEEACVSSIDTQTAVVPADDLLDQESDDDNLPSLPYIDMDRDTTGTATNNPDEDMPLLSRLSPINCTASTSTENDMLSCVPDVVDLHESKKENMDPPGDFDTQVKTQTKKKRKRPQSPWLTKKPKKRKVNKDNKTKKPRKTSEHSSKYAWTIFKENVYQENPVFRVCKDGSIEMFFDVYSTNQNDAEEENKQSVPKRTLIEIEKDVPDLDKDILKGFQEEIDHIEIVYLGRNTDGEINDAPANEQLSINIGDNQNVAESEEPVSPSSEAYHDFNFEMPPSPGELLSPTETSGPTEVQMDSTSHDDQISTNATDNQNIDESDPEQNEMKWDVVISDQRYQPKVVVQDLKSTTEWESYMSNSKPSNGNDDDVMNLKITCVQSLTGEDPVLVSPLPDLTKNSLEKRSEHEEELGLHETTSEDLGEPLSHNLTSGVSIGLDSPYSDHGSDGPVGNEATVETEEPKLEHDKNDSSCQDIPHDTQDVPESSAQKHVISNDDVSDNVEAEDDLDGLLDERSELQKKLKELDQDDNTNSSDQVVDRESPTNFDPTSIEEMGTRLSILRDLDEESNKGKKERFLARLTEVKKELNRKKSSVKSKKKQSALDLILSESDVSSDSEQGTDKSPEKVSPCSDMKKRKKRDHDTDTDEEQLKGHKERQSTGSEQLKSVKSETSSSKSCDKPQSSNGKDEPYSNRLRNKRMPSSDEKHDVVPEKKRKKKRSKRRKAKLRNVETVESHNKSDMNSSTKDSCQMVDVPDKTKTDVESKNVKPPTETMTTEKTKSDDAESPTKSEKCTSSKDIKQQDDLVNSEKWVETCESIFKGELNKEKDETLFDGYTESTETKNKPCQDPTQWLNKLIRLNQKKKDGGPIDKKDKKQERSSACMEHVSPLAGISRVDMLKHANNTPKGPEPPIWSSQSDAYVKHPKYPVMPRGMKIKRTGSTTNRIPIDKRPNTEGSVVKSPKDLSSEQVSELVSKVLNIFNPNEGDASKSVKNVPPPVSVVSPGSSHLPSSGASVTSQEKSIPPRSTSVYQSKHSEGKQSDVRDAEQKDNCNFNPSNYSHYPRKHNILDPRIHKSVMQRPLSRPTRPTGQPIHQRSNSVGNNMPMMGALGSLNIDAVEANTITLLTFSALNAAVGDMSTTNPQTSTSTSESNEYQSDRSFKRRDSTSSTGDSALQSPRQSPMMSPTYKSSDLNRDPRRRSPAGCSPREEASSKVNHTEHVIDENEASQAIEREMYRESRTKITKLWEESICAPKKLGAEQVALRELKEKGIRKDTTPTSIERSRRKSSVDVRALEGMEGTDNIPWNIKVNKIDKSDGTCYKQRDTYGQCSRDPRLKQIQPLSGVRTITKYTKNIPLENLLDAHEVVSNIKSPNAGLSPELSTTTKDADKLETILDEQKLPYMNVVHGAKVESPLLTHDHKLPQKQGHFDDTQSPSVSSEVKEGPNIEKEMCAKGKKAAAMWSSLLDTRNDGQVRNVDIGGFDEATRRTMEEVWELGDVEWTMLNAEMVETLDARIQHIDDTMIFNDPTKGLTSERKRKLMASDSINDRVARELHIENKMHLLFEEINQLRNEYDQSYQTGSSDEFLRKLDNQIKIMDVKYERYIKELEDLKRFYKSNVVEVLPEMFRLPEERKKFISMEGNMLFLVSKLTEMDCKKLYALKEEIRVNKTVIETPKAPFQKRQQAKLKLGWLHTERKEALCELCMNMLSTKDSVILKFNSRIIWCRKVEQALHEAGDCDELLKYIQQRIQSLEIYLNVLSHVQRTENGVWMKGKTTALHFDDDGKQNTQKTRKITAKKEGTKTNVQHIDLHSSKSLNANNQNNRPDRSDQDLWNTINQDASNKKMMDGFSSGVRIPGLDIQDDTLACIEERASEIVEQKGSKSSCVVKVDIDKSSKRHTDDTVVQPYQEHSTQEFDEFSFDKSLVIDIPEENPMEGTGDLASSSNASDSAKSDNMTTTQSPSSNQVNDVTNKYSDDCQDIGKIELSISKTDENVEKNDSVTCTGLDNETLQQACSNKSDKVDTNDLQHTTKHGSPVNQNISKSACEQKSQKDETKATKDEENRNDTPNQSSSGIESAHKHRDFIGKTGVVSQQQRYFKNSNQITELLKELRNTVERAKIIGVDQDVDAIKNHGTGTDGSDPMPEPKMHVHSCSDEMAQTSMSLKSSTRLSGNVADTTNIVPEDMDIADNDDECNESCQVFPTQSQNETPADPVPSVSKDHADVDWRTSVHATYNLMNDPLQTSMQAGSNIFHDLDERNTMYPGPTPCSSVLGFNNNTKSSVIPQKPNRRISRWDVKPRNKYLETSDVTDTYTDKSGDRIVTGEHSRKYTDSKLSSVILAKAKMFRDASAIVDEKLTQKNVEQRTVSVHSPCSTTGRVNDDIDKETTPATVSGNDNIMVARSEWHDGQTDANSNRTESGNGRETGLFDSKNSDHSRSVSVESERSVGRKSSRSRSRSPVHQYRQRSHHSSQSNQNRGNRNIQQRPGRSPGRGNETGRFANVQVSVNDPTIRRILQGDPVLIEMLSHPLTTTRLASMLPNVRDRETVFHLAREVQNERYNPEHRN